MSQGNAVWGAGGWPWVCPWRQSRGFVFSLRGRQQTHSLLSERTSVTLATLFLCFVRSNHCCSFSALCWPLRTLGEPSCVRASKPLLRISAVSVQQCSSAGWTSSSFPEETIEIRRRVSNTPLACLIYWLSTWAKWSFLTSSHGGTGPAVVHFISTLAAWISLSLSHKCWSVWISCLSQAPQPVMQHWPYTIIHLVLWLNRLLIINFGLSKCFPGLPLQLLGTPHKELVWSALT